MQTILGMSLLLLWILTLAFAASINEDGTILDRGPLIRCEIAMQRLDQRKEQLVFSHAACSYYKWVWLQVNFEGTIFAGRMKSAKTSKFKRLENKALYGRPIIATPAIRYRHVPTCPATSSVLPLHWLLSWPQSGMRKKSNVRRVHACMQTDYNA